ncbi:AraC family transcriptional regulator [Aquimarina sp. BL5]|nr:AraC family transcriptional regulator [Aquimarina sp. BL5]
MELIIDFTLHLGILANALLLYILWKNGWKEFHIKVLFIIFLWIFFTQICFFGFINKNEIIFYATFLFLDTIPISIGPLFFLYVKAIFYPTKNILKKNVKHFIIPFIYIMFASIPKLVSLFNSPNVFGHLRVGLENLVALSIIYSLIYSIIAIKILNKTKKLVNLYYSNVNHSDFNWLLKFLYATILIISIDISITIFEVLYGDINIAIGIIAFFVVFLIVYLAYHGISQTKVLLPKFLLEKEVTVKKDISKTDVISLNGNKTTYSTNEMQSLQQQLETLMQKQKWYLNAELSLKSLSEKLDISDKKLSYLLNQYMQISFYDYINHFRVEEVKEKIKNPSFSQYTLLAIALECGFNSKTSFNRTFHRFESVTPSSFRNQILKTE